MVPEHPSWLGQELVMLVTWETKVDLCNPSRKVHGPEYGSAQV